MRVWVAAGAMAVTLLVAGCEPDVAADPKPVSNGAAPSPAKPAGKQPKRPAAPKATRKLPAGVDGIVTKHTDGDTLRVDGVKIRLIGVDTPEVHSGRECYGRAASARTAALLPIGTRVRLVYDVGRLDRYGRTLAYVYRARDGLFVNGELVRGGFATTMTVPPNVSHADEFLRVQRAARVARRGLWSACPTGAGASPAQPRTTPKPSPQRRGSCHPSYTPCVPITSDVDCEGGSGNGPVYTGTVRVIGPDEYGLDPDHDGVGCEP